MFQVLKSLLISTLQANAEELGHMLTGRDQKQYVVVV